MRTLRYWKVILALVVVGVCGGLLGAAAALKLENQRQARRARGGVAGEWFRDRLVSQLQLTPEQAAAVGPILDRNGAELRSIVTNAVAQATQVGRRMDAEMRPLLTPDQQQRLDELTQRRERLREQWLNGERLSREQRERLRERLRQWWAERTNPPPALPGPK